MKNTVLKTAAITFLAMTILLCGTIFALSIFAPSVMVKVTSDLGLKKCSVKYSERLYEKTKKDEDLVNLVFSADEADEYKVIVKYSPLLLEKENFPQGFDGNLRGEALKNFVTGSYFEALIKVKTSDNAVIEAAEKYYNLKYGGYKDGNPYRVLTALSDELSPGLISAIEEKIDSKKTAENITQSELELIEADLNILKTQNGL